MTEGTPALNAALSKLQGELPKVDRDRTVEVQQKNGGTYSYSYVTLANLSDAILPLLAKHGLAFTALPGTGSDGKMALRYYLRHDSGEHLEGEFPISGEGGIQMIGGRITYARRYCLAALVGVAADEDDESRLGDDQRPTTAQRAAAAQPAKAATKKTAAKTAQRAAAPPLPSDGPQPYTPAQRAKLMAAFGQLGIEKTERLEICSRIVGRELGSANDLTKQEAKTVIDKLEEATGQDNPALHLAELTAADSPIGDWPNTATAPADAEGSDQ